MNHFLDYYLVKETVGSSLVVIGKYKTLERAKDRLELQNGSKYSFERFSICTEEEYKELAMKYV